MHCMFLCWYCSRNSNRNRNAQQLNMQSAATKSNRSNMFATLKLYLRRWIQDYFSYHSKFNPLKWTSLCSD